MNAVILACTTLIEYVEKAQERCGTAYPIVELDRKYHDEPADMRRHILQALSGLEESVDTVLAAMGFCGGSWQDAACSKTLVIPRTADCVALAMTTPERYSPDLKQPGHMYLFGDGKTGFSIRAMYENLRRKYDEEIADIVFDMYFANYRHLDVIDNGLYDCYDTEYVERAQEDADRIGAELDFVPGSNVLLENLVAGKWDGRFLTVPPNTPIKQGMFYDD